MRVANIRRVYYSVYYSEAESLRYIVTEHYTYFTTSLDNSTNKTKLRGQGDCRDKYRCQAMQRPVQHEPKRPAAVLKPKETKEVNTANV